MVPRPSICACPDSTCYIMAALLNRLAGLGVGLAIAGAAVNNTLYNGEGINHFKILKPVWMCLSVHIPTHIPLFYYQSTKL